jgi:2-polyprenyl-3-methyl-5-hydroxy-6-metoxy-1,4-benzoquinol methylase
VSIAAGGDANPDVVALLPIGARRIVDAGCGNGAMAAEWLARHPHCDYVGIEREPELAALARTRARRVVEADVEHLDDAALASLAPVDAWVFGDVLEHLVDPWTVLARVRCTLAPDGVVVACVPNMQHWSVTARLVSGELHYESAGLLDRTHLRWFTRTTIDAMFRGAGYGITRWVRRVYDAPLRTRALAAIGNFATVIGADADEAMADADVFQWVVEARAVRQEAVE